MGKNQSASNLPNIIQYNNGSINFVSGSTLLMQISSSGAITTTGVISGSNALSSSYAVNSDQLDGFDSTAFVFTSSFNTYSSSMSTRTTNLETASGSFSTRVTRIEGNYATTGSNIFTGAQTVCANITSTGTIIAQTLNVQQVTSSIVYSSGSNIFGCSLANTQQFTGSVTITGSLGVSGNTCVGGTITGTTVYGSTLVCSAMVCSPQSAFTYTGTTGNAVRINGDNLTTGTALSIVANNGSPSHTGNVVEICNAFNAGAAAKLLCLYQGDDGDGIYVNMARGGVGLTIDGAGTGYSAIFNNGNVGIGTASPCSLLDVTVGGAGARRFFVNYDDSLITIKGASNTTNPENLRLVGDNIIFNTGTAGSGTERMRFTGTGIACFACQICAPSFLSSGTICSAGNTTIAGCLGIGTNSPSSYCHGGSNRVVEVYNCNTSANSQSHIILSTGASTTPGAIGSVTWVIPNSSAANKMGSYMGADIEADSSTAVCTNIFLATRNNETTPQLRLRIFSAGIACFSCQICAPSIVFCSSVNSGYTPIKVCNPNSGASAYTEISIHNNTSNQAGLFYNSSARSVDGGVCSLSLYNDSTNGNLRLRTGNNLVLATGATATDRLTIDTNGVACFACSVGISTTPSAKLHVQTAINADGIYLSRCTSNKQAIFIAADDAVGAYIAGSTAPDGTSTQTDGAGRIILQGGQTEGLQFQTSCVASGAAQSWQTRLKIFNSGVACFRCQVCVGGSIIPLANGTQDLGTSSLRWCTVYTSDLSLNNGIGDYTIVEGENDLFLYNNKQCKVYKFIVQEVCPEIAPAKRSI